MMEQGILPNNATLLERAFDVAGSRILETSTDIRSLWRPGDAPAEFLPWLAWGFSTDVWRAEWDDAKKRAVVGRAYDLHRKKGTLAGIKTILDILNVKRGRVITPPNKTFLSPNFTDAGRREWLRNFPEIRVFRDREAGERVGAIPAPGAWQAKAKWYLNGASAVSPSYLVRSTAPKRSAARVFRVEPDGTETELTVTAITRRTVRRTVVTQRGSRTAIEGPTASGAGDTLRFVENTHRGFGGMLSDPEATRARGKMFLTAGPRRFVTTQQAFERTYFTRLADDTFEPEFDRVRATVQPIKRRAVRGIGLFLETGDPLSARAERVAQPGKQRGTFAGAMFPSRGAAGTRWVHLADQGAGTRLFQRTHLFDAAVAARTGSTSWHLGARRLSMPAYNAELGAGVRKRRPARQFARFTGDFLVATSQGKLNETLQALRWGKSKRDRVLVNTKTREPVDAGNNIFAGAFAAGDFMEAS